MIRFPVHSESNHAGLVVLEPSSEYTNMPELPFEYLLISPAHFKLPGIEVINPVTTDAADRSWLTGSSSLGLHSYLHYRYLL